MDDWKLFWECMAWNVAISVVLVGVPCWFAKPHDTYRQGQIDAANGVMKYELVEQVDGTVSWEAADAQVP